MVPELGMLVGAFVVDGFDHVARPAGSRRSGRGHTTGVPLLYPWANRLARLGYTAAGRKVSLRGLPLPTDDAGRPIHGTMLGHDAWTVTALGRGRIEARCDFGDRPDLLDVVPVPARAARLDARGSPARARVDTTVEATGATPVPVSFGWHPYWQLPGRRDDWSVAAARRRPRAGSTGAGSPPGAPASSPPARGSCATTTSTTSTRSPERERRSCAATVAGSGSRSTPATPTSRCSPRRRRASAVSSR